MKTKLFSLLIAICMVLSLIPAAAAAEDTVSPSGIEEYPVLEYGVDLTIYCDDQFYTYVTFTPTVSGNYMFDSLSDGHTEAVLCDAGMSQTLASDSGFRCAQSEHKHWGSTFCIVRWLEAGVTYVLGVRMYSEGEGEVIVRGGCMHNYALTDTEEATCCEDGTYYFTCGNCGRVTTRTIYAYPDFTEEITKEPTCLEEGVLSKTCIECGRVRTEAIPTIHHAYNDALKCIYCGQGVPASSTWSDEYGNSLTWRFHDGLLILTGEGDMPARDCEYDYNWNVIGWYSTPWEGLPVTEVVVGSGITEISRAAFLGFDQLEKVTMPNTLTYIAEKAFADCTSLTALVLPEGLMHMGSSVFAGSGLREVHIPSTYTDSWDVYSTFYKAAKLERITVAEDNPALAADSQGAVYTKDMTGLELLPEGFQGTFVIPAVVESMSTGMFARCADLEAIVVEEGNTEYYSRDGILYESYYEFQYVPESGDWEEVYVGEQMLCCPPAKELGAYRVEDWVTALDTSAFNNCRFLTELTIPAECIYADVEDISRGCAALEAIWYEEGHPVYITDEDGLVYNGEKYHEYYSGYYSEEELKSFGVGGLLCWVPSCRTGLLEIPEGVKGMRSGAVSDTRLSAIRFPSTFTSFFVYAVNGEEKNIEWVLFTGEKPDLWSYDAGEDCTLHNVDATIYYPGWLESWSEPELYSCGNEEQTYVPYEQGKEPVWGQEEPENPFADVPAGSFYEESVLWAVEKGITNGLTPDSFGPTATCNRAQVVTFLWRAAGCVEPESTSHNFVDVQAGSFYEKPVLWAVENGITTGSDATHFNPTGVCNRAQVVTFMYRTFRSPEVSVEGLPFADVPAGSWYEAPIAWAVANGITNGLDATHFGPTAVCNRAQVVTFLYRAFA